MMKKALSALLVIAAVTFNPAKASESPPACNPPPKKPPPTTTRVSTPSMIQEVNVHYDRQEPINNCCTCSQNSNKDKEELTYATIKYQIDLLVEKITHLENKPLVIQPQTPSPINPKAPPEWHELSLEKIVVGFFSFVAKTAWPLVSLIMFILLKDPIIDLLSRLKKGKIGIAEAEFNDIARKAKEEAKAVKIDLEDVSEKYESQIAKNPRELVITKWLEIELALKNLIETRAMPEAISGNYIQNSKKYNVVSMIRTIQRNKLLSDDYIPLIHELRVMRNEAAHTENFMLSHDAVGTYVQIADRILAAIREALYQRPDVAF